MRISGSPVQQADKARFVYGLERLQRIIKDRKLELRDDLLQETNAVRSDVQFLSAVRQKLVCHVEKVVGHSQFVLLPSSWQAVLKVLKVVTSFSLSSIT